MKRFEKTLAGLAAVVYVSIGLFASLSIGKPLRFLGVCAHAVFALYIIFFDYEAYYAVRPASKRYPLLEVAGKIAGWSLLLIPMLFLIVAVFVLRSNLPGGS